MKIKKRWIIALIVLTLGIIVWHRHRGAAMPAATPVVVKTAAVQVTNLPITIKAIGTVAATTVDITPETAGHVANIVFTDGAEVKQGDTLIQLDDAVFKTKLQSMNAEYQYSDQTFQRLKKLAGKGIVTQQAIDQADADRKEKKAALEEASVVYHKMTLIAPFSGRLGQRKVNIGDYVNVGQGVVTLTDVSHLRVEYNLPEKYLAKVQLGQPVVVTTAAYPGESFPGKIAYISPTISPDNRTIPVYAELAPMKTPLTSGLYVDVTQHLGAEKQAFMIPSRSLVPVLSGNSVFKVVNGKAVSVNVEVGARTTDKVEITQGLSATDHVVTDGQVKLVNGQPVTTG